MLDEKRIYVIGSKFNVQDFYEESDIVVGTGRVAIEAISLGKTTVAVGNAGYIGIITPKNYNTQWDLYFGDHGQLDKVNVKKLTEDLAFLVDNPDKRLEIGSVIKKLV